MNAEKGHPEPDLELVDTRKLIDELMRRHQAMVFAAQPFDKDAVAVYRSSGSYVAGIGMAEVLKADILSLARKSNHR